LFGVTPEMLQQRQFEMADRQAQEYAQLTPLQRASYGLARGGYQLAGALGGEDPQLRMVSTRNAIARQIDPTDPQSMMRGIQALQQAGDQVGAMQLAQVLRQVEGDIAQRFQREAAGEASLAAARRQPTQAVAQSLQEARRISEITQALQNPELSLNERIGLEAERDQLRKAPSAEATTAEMRNAAALAARKGPPGSPEYETEYQNQLSRLTTRTEGREPTTNELTNARAFAATKGEPGSPEYNAAFSEEYKRLTAPKETREATSTEVTNARALAALAGPVGSDAYNAEFRTQLSRLTTKAESREPTTNELTNARALAAQAGPVGSEAYNTAFMAEYNRLTTPKEAREPTTSELTNARAIAARAGAVGTPEYNAAFMAEYNRLTAPKETQQPEIARLQALRDSYPVGSKERKEVQDRIDSLGRSGAVSVTNILPKQEAGVNKNKVELAGQVEANAINATDRVTLARNLRSFLPQAFTGLGSDVKLEASRFAAALGIPVTGTTESQIIDQILGQMTIGAAGQLKGALSDKDREFLKQTIGTRGLTRSALEFVSQRIEREARVDERLNEAVQAWQKSGKSLNDFNFATQRSEAARQIDADIKRLEELRRKQRGG
jgi:hypothetical protein